MIYPKPYSIYLRGSIYRSLHFLFHYPYISPQNLYVPQCFATASLHDSFKGTLLKPHTEAADTPNSSAVRQPKAVSTKPPPEEPTDWPQLRVQALGFRVRI